VNQLVTFTDRAPALIRAAGRARRRAFGNSSSPTSATPTLAALSHTIRKAECDKRHSGDERPPCLEASRAVLALCAGCARGRNGLRPCTRGTNPMPNRWQPTPQECALIVGILLRTPISKGGVISKALPKIIGDIQSPSNRGTEPKRKVL
jgi:hypothetical protein